MSLNRPATAEHSDVKNAGVAPMRAIRGAFLDFNPEPTAKTVAALAELTVSLVIMGDDLTVESTYIMGEKSWG